MNTVRFFNQRIQSVILVGFGILLLWGCKENTILPPDLVPPIDNINTFQDTSITVLTHNEYQDSVLTGGYNGTSRVSNSTTYYHALGVIANDPVFGKTVAGFHVDVIPPTNAFTFKGANQLIDSIVLSIPFHSNFGDTINAIPQTIHVYRSLKLSSRDSAQYEDYTDVYQPSAILAAKSINYNTFKTDSPLVSGAKVIPQLRFVLPSWLADSIQSQIALGAAGALNTTDDFLKWWNGFYITPADTNVGNTLGYFNTYGTRMYVYYRYTNTNGGQDTTNTIFGFDAAKSNRFNHITRNYNGTLAAGFINTGATAGDSLLFLQSEPGLSTVLTFPGLINIGNHIINKAELTFNTAYPTALMADTIKAGLIPRLQVFKVDAAGVNKIVSDYTTFGTNFVDGKRYEVTLMGMTYIQYRFNLTETFQKVISQKDANFKLKIMGLNTGKPASFQSVLKGSGSSVAVLKPKLNLIYTKIK